MLFSIALNNISHPEAACGVTLEVQIRAWIPDQHQLAQTWLDIYLEITVVETQSLSNLKSAISCSHYPSALHPGQTWMFKKANEHGMISFSSFLTNTKKISCSFVSL